ncbi:C-type lectin subunit B [Trichinella spiralis]|uniref:C-type lectin subunit B n=1 Tax=Trichinella spiralis TaxID=6334 RepID=UPI0001EFBC42|nr:C-type lectin subunit B [Trichinella spiralis]
MLSFTIVFSTVFSFHFLATTLCVEFKQQQRIKRLRDEDEPAIVLADDQQTKYLQRDIKLICPEDWKLNGLTCYRVYTQPRSWSQALSLCSRYGSQLARILTVEENDFVYHLARAQLKQSDHKEFWIGKKI